jgi:Skp family chaperone for outer membrane proteins
MTKLLFGSALAVLAAALPAVASAQRLGPAVVAVVDTDRISRECTACRAAATQLQTQNNNLRTRATTLQQQLNTQGQPIQTAVTALNGRQPDAALQQRITAFQTQQQNAQRELATAERNLSPRSCTSTSRSARGFSRSSARSPRRAAPPWRSIGDLRCSPRLPWISPTRCSLSSISSFRASA